MERGQPIKSMERKEERMTGQYLPEPNHEH